MPEQAIFSIVENEKVLVNGTKKIPLNLAYLKEIAATGSVLFRGKKLVLDLFSKASFSYTITSQADGFLLSGNLKVRNQEFPLDTLDYLMPGKPSLFVKGIQLFVIDENVVPSMLTIKRLQQHELNAFLAEAKEDEIPVHGIEKLSIKQSDPLPFLKLRDRSGAFADLWMDYGASGTLRYEPSNNIACEKQWENDLLETDFIRKIVASTAYYCPLNKVAKSLGFLLEIGWKIIDCNGKRVVRETSQSLSADLQQQHILISGEVQYESFKADLKQVAGAFVKRERFLNLDENCVGLISDTPSFSQFVEDGEIVSEGIAISKYSLKELFESETIHFKPRLNELKSHLNILSPTSSFHGTLRPYQIKGLEWLYQLYQLRLGAILADDMGLGKTIQVLAFLAQLDASFCHVIVMPTSLLFNWQYEIAKFLPTHSCYLHHGPKRLGTLPESGIIVTSYATLRNDFTLFANHNIHCLIADEAQVIKNKETKIAKTLSQISCEFRLSLTGTPIENHLEELFSHFHFLMPGFLTDDDKLYQNMSEQRFLKKLQKKTSPFILRRKKEEVLDDLPEKIEQIVYVDMAPQQRIAYDTYLSSFKKNVLSKVSLEGVGKHRIAIFEALLRLRQICCHPLLVSSEHDDCGKLEILLEDITSLASEGRKALVFSQFTSMLNLIGKELQSRDISYVRLDGETKNREEVVNEFQNSAIPIFLISLKAGGVGLNLTAADHVFIYDPWWNEAVEDQAISRAHRLGQKKSVLAKRYVTLESIEEKMMKLKESKNRLIQEMFTDNPQLSEEELLALFD